MIKLRKKEKPHILLKNEEKWLTELMEYVDAGEKVPQNIERRYAHSEIKETLIEETFHKCAYCESKITHIDYGDVEHIEPKSIIRNKTFDWINLTLSCRKCNQNKGNYYDESLPLLNPYTDDVEEKIIFFGPFPSSRGTQAEFTIRKLKLDRTELIERRVELVKTIQPLIDRYIDAQGALKILIYEDLIKYKERDKEYSSMMRTFLKELEAPNSIV